METKLQQFLIDDLFIFYIEYRDYEIEIVPDDSSQSPNDWGNDDHFLVYDHKDLYIEKEGFDPNKIFFDWYHEEGELFHQKTYEGYWVFGVDAYIHGGVHLALRGSSKAAMLPDRRWDVSFKGFYLVKRQKGTWTEDEARVLAEGMIESWNQYLSGDVWGYNIPDLNESCWGYYGQEQCIEDAKNIIDHVQSELLHV